MFISICNGKNCITIGYEAFILGIILFSNIVMFSLAFFIKTINNYKLRKYYAEFLKEKINSLTDISVDDKVFNDLLLDFKKNLGYKIGNYVKELSNNTYQIDTGKVSVILDESLKKFNKELKSNSELKKIYLSRLAELFEE